MLIECTIRRKNGSTVKLGTQEYKFAPTDKDPRHLCEVKDEAHIERLLSINESFVAAKGAKASDDEAKKAAAEAALKAKAEAEEAEAKKKAEEQEAAKKAAELAAQKPAEDGLNDSHESQSEVAEQVAAAAAQESAAQPAPEAPAAVEAPTAAAPATTADSPTIRDELIAQAIAAGIKDPHKMSTKRLIAALDK